MNKAHGDMGERIRQARLYAGLSQTELAHKVGYTAANPVSKIERGDVSFLDAVVIARIATVCKVDLLWLMEPAVKRSKKKLDLRPRSERE